MSRTKKIAVGGLVTAFSCVIMIISNIIPLGLYTFPACAGIVICILSYIAGKSYAWLSYIATAFVSFIMCTDKEAVLCFILFLGYYPLIKSYIDKIHLKVVNYIIKLVIFNVAACCLYLLMFFVFSLPEDMFEIFGVNIPIVFLIVLNVLFILYD